MREYNFIFLTLYSIAERRTLLLLPLPPPPYSRVCSLELCLGVFWEGEVTPEVTIPTVRCGIPKNRLWGRTSNGGPDLEKAPAGPRKAECGVAIQAH